MALVVNTNVGSINAQRQLVGTTNEMSTAMERLSSGKRINSAADDAAGLAISTRMTSQIKGLNMAVRNANDGISLTQTAEGAMQEVTDMLQRMRELAIQSSSGVSSDSDRASLDDEVTQLKAEIDRIAGSTRFNNVNILDGSYAANIQIGDQADQTLAIGISSVATTAMGETADGLADDATAAELVLTGMTTDSAAYAGKSFSVEVNGVTSTVTLPTVDETTSTAASVAGGFIIEDTGPATSVMIADDTAAYTDQVIDLSAHANRVFAIRNDRTEFVDIDFSDALADILGVTRAQLDDPSTYSSSESDKVTAAQLVEAVQTTLDAETALQGDSRVLISINEYGAITFTDANGSSDRIALNAGNIDGESTAGTFMSTYVDSTITGDTSSNILTVDFTNDSGSAGVLAAAFKVKVNDDTEYTDIDINDKLNDSSIVYDRDNVMAHELVAALQAEFDENFSGTEAVTVGMTKNGELTFSIAGDGTNAKIQFAETSVMIAGTATDSTGLATLVGGNADNEIDNLAATTDWSAVDSLNDPIYMENAAAEDWAFQAQLNDGEFKTISVIPYIQELVSDTANVRSAEAVAVMQAAFDDNFGVGEITVSLDEDGYMQFDPAGKGFLKITDLDDGITGSPGNFITNHISGNDIEINEFVVASADEADRTGDQSFGFFNCSASAVELLDAFMSDEQGYESSHGTAGTRITAFADTIYSGTVASEQNDSGNPGLGITIGASETITFTLDGTQKSAINITEGRYATLEDLAAEIQQQIDRAGNYAGTDALTVSVKTYTDTNNLEFGRNVRYLAVENAYGKSIELDATLAVAFGSENDSSIDATEDYMELGITPDKTNYKTHGLIDGGVNTAENDLVLSVEKDGNTFSYTLNLTEDDNLAIETFADEVLAQANAQFAGHGLSFTGGYSDGQFSLALDQTGASTVTLSGAAADQAFGGSLSANGTDASPGMADMTEVAAAISADLTAVGASASYNADTQAIVITDGSGATGANSSITVSGDDLADLQISGTLSATGVSSNATGQRLDLVSVASAEDATAALDSIDNALEYISSQRAELGAVENRLNHTVNNLMNVVENTSASRSRIQDADYAVESANLAKLQVMQQAGTAMLAQANASAQLVLSLIG